MESASVGSARGLGRSHLGPGTPLTPPGASVPSPVTFVPLAPPTRLSGVASPGDDRVPLLAPPYPSDAAAADFASAAGHGAAWTGNQPWFDAAVRGDVPALRAMLERGQRVDAADGKGRTALWLACKQGREAAARLLLEAGASAAQACDDDPVPGNAHKGMLPIHAAAVHGHEAVVRLLLERGVPVDAPRGDGSTPLRSAAYSGREAVVRLLLDRGARVDAAVKGTTALHLAAFRDYVPIMRLLLDRGASVTAPVADTGRLPIHHARSEAAARLLFDYGSPVDATYNSVKKDRTITGYTLLHNAADMGYVGVMRAALEQGAELEPLDSKGRTPLIVACASGEAAAARLLLDLGAAWDREDGDGLSALEHALRWRQRALVEPFLECPRVLLAPARVGAVCGPLVAALGPECDPAALVAKFPSGKLNCALHLARLLQEAAKTNPDQASLLLERRDEAFEVVYQVLDAMGRTFGERLQRRAKLNNAVVPWLGCMGRLAAEKDEWMLEERLRKCTELTPGDALDTWLATQVYNRKAAGDAAGAKAAHAAAIDKKVPIADSVDVLERRLPGVGSALDIAIDLDLYGFFGHPVVQRYIHRLSESAPGLEAASLLPAALLPKEKGPDGEPNPSPKPASGGLWWEAPGHLLNSWRGKFAADLVAYLAFLLLVALAVSSWAGEHGRGRLPLLVLLALQSLGMLLFEYREGRERGAGDYFGDVFNLIDLAVLSSTLLLASLGVVAEAVPAYGYLAGYALPILALVFIPASLRLLEFGYISPILGPMLVVFGRMARDVLSVLLVALVVFGSFLFGLWGFSASFRGPRAAGAGAGGEDAEAPLSLSEAAGSLYFAVLGESDYDLMRSRVPFVGSAFFSIYQIITVILLLNVLTGLFSFSFTAIFENARHVYAFGRAKIILRYNRMGRRLVPPLNLIWLLLSPAPPLAAAVVNAVSGALLLPPLLLALGLSALWSSARALWERAPGELEREEAAAQAAARAAWGEAIEAHRAAQLAGRSAAEAEEAGAAAQLAGALAYDEASERPDPVPPGPLEVAHTAENLPRNVEILHERSEKAGERIAALEASWRS
eukprot:tig00020806_g14031.t1